MREVRQKNYVLSARLFVHIGMLNMLFMSFDLLSNPSLIACARMGFLTIVYSMHWSVATGALRPMPHQIKGVCAGWWTLFAAFVLLAPCHPTARDAMFMQGFKIGSRLTMTSIFMDTELCFIFQALISVASLVSELFIHNTGQEPFLLLGMEFQNFVGSVALSALLEFLIRSRIHALLDFADAETLVSSFQHVLRGICDGDILLTSDMTIHGPGDCLQNLLMNRANLHGKAFEMLLPPDERQRFADFITASTKAALDPADGPRMTPPTCLRVSLCGASNTRVPADIFHVPVPHLFGADHPYHLLAISEDSESRNPPALAKDIPDMARIRERSERLRSRTASSSGSSASGSSVWEPLPELAGMMLLVDGSSPFLDIEQAHLSFERRVGDEEVESSMPCLRKVCRPTDWESIRKKIDRFAASGESSAQELRSICLRMPDDPRRFLKARCVQMSTFESPHAEGSQDQSNSVPIKICLQLSHFVQEESRQRQQSELAGIRELRGRRPVSDKGSESFTSATFEVTGQQSGLDPHTF
ncbi:unnamed protein product [Symbiodinium necroappetens]|uniref:Uncharacterized protein n=1 Tax=Symbiodinium necroappetens TaxID=1628268 RepID=A0A812LGM5_9DINO|nr:unnamed protein product [Symbiodinium necroappetens]